MYVPGHRVPTALFSGKRLDKIGVVQGKGWPADAVIL